MNDPNEAQERLFAQVRRMQRSGYALERGRAYPVYDPVVEPGRREDYLTWDRLSWTQRTEVMQRYVDWGGWAPSRVDTVIGNVLANREPERWLDPLPKRPTPPAAGRVIDIGNEPR